MSSLPYKLYRAAQVRELDRLAIEEFRIPGATLMARAGGAAFDAITHRWPDARRLGVMCGVGNNGGDGYIVARLAHEAGCEVTVYQVGDHSKLKGDALGASVALQEKGVKPVAYSAQALDGFDVIVDAIFGTGLVREVSGEWLAAIEAVNNSGTAVLALDIPSGIHADSGRILGAAVHADLTITFIGVKQGMLTGHGLVYCGDVLCNDLQVPSGAYERISPAAIRIAYEALKYHLQARVRSAHKGLYGHVLVIGGDHGMSGAARMAGEAALRSGAGLVSIATRTSHAAVISAARPELMAHGVETVSELQILMSRATVLVVGPGLGRSAWGRTMLSTVVESSKPMVVDADALNLLAENPASHRAWILTPHPGEAARLLKTTSAEVQSDRFVAARKIQSDYDGVCVLKGAGSLIDNGEDPVALCTAGNPGMASGGMGDVLSGVVAGLWAQGLQQTVAARLGVCIHAEAGDRAAFTGERGIIASDLYPHIHRLVNPD